MRSSGARPHARAALPALQWGVPYADSSVFYKKCTKTRIGLLLYTLTIGPLVRSGPRFIAYQFVHVPMDFRCTGVATAFSAVFTVYGPIREHYTRYFELFITSGITQTGV